MNMYYTSAMTIKEQMLIRTNPTAAELILAEAVDVLNERVSRLEKPNQIPESLKVMDAKCKKPNIIA